MIDYGGCLKNVDNMADKSKKSSINLPALAVVGLLVVAAFLIGSLWTKVQLLEGSLSSEKQIAGGGDGGGGAPAVPPAGKADVAPVSDSDHVRGNRSARIALIEYSDLECPFCKRFHPTAQQVVDEYDDRVMWVYRHFPLDNIHSKARKEAEATECAAQLGGEDGFWDFVDKIYEVTPSNNGLDLDTLPDLAAGIGLDRGAFQNCLDSGKFTQLVEDNYQSGIKAGITGTPGNILLDTETGETRVLPGAVPFEQLKSAIDAMLAG